MYAQEQKGLGWERWIRQSRKSPQQDIGPISLGMKQMGARSAGNPHAACDVAGAGNVERLECFGRDPRASPRPYVRPAKAGMFSRRKACRGKNQRPRSLDSRVEGNQDPEAYRQRLPWGGDESPGRNNSERKSGLENE